MNELDKLYSKSQPLTINGVTIDVYPLSMEDIELLEPIPEATKQQLMERSYALVAASLKISFEEAKKLPGTTILTIINHAGQINRNDVLEEQMKGVRERLKGLLPTEQQ